VIKPLTNWFLMWILRWLRPVNSISETDFSGGTNIAASVWLLNYDIVAADRDHYLSWFHDEHILEKLARPGYRWAAHYEAPASNDAAGLYRYIGMFGGASTKVFLDPSPAQLKLTQTENTRAMMRLRQNPSAAILAHEWSSFATDNILDGQIDGQISGQIDGPYIDLLSIEAPQHDERIGSIAAQHLAPDFVAQDGATACHKFTNVMGAPRHMMLFEMASGECRPGSAEAPVTPLDLAYLSELRDDMQLARRWGRKIWPV
jgi:hypothetical protein